ncbi:8280_t:CDS:1, partial [Gigaspora margarita]
MGLALAVLKTLQLYINNILKLAGTAIAVDFFFPRNQCIRIISVYLIMTNKKLNEKMQKIVAEWTRQAIAREYNIVRIGDFNSDRTKEKKLLPLFKAPEQL